jgi:small basic protein
VIILIPLLALAAGFGLGRYFHVTIPPSISTYMSVAILAGLDTLLGGLRSLLEKDFDQVIFLTGFFTNTLLAALLVFVGDKLGVNLYLAAVFSFGYRLFQNLAFIRRDLLHRANVRQVLSIKEKQE